MNRRQALQYSGGIIGATLFANTALSNKHQHAGHTSSQQDKLIDALSNCLVKGAVCEQHCVELIANGEKGLVDCQKAVRAMLVTCEAMLGLSIQGSKFSKDLAKICISACEACVVECKKHDHEACKECLKACEECIQACKKV